MRTKTTKAPRTTVGGSENYVLLRGGLAVPVAPILLLTDLTFRGVELQRAGDDLCVRPWSLVTDEERIALHRWKSHVIALLEYEPPALSG